MITRGRTNGRSATTRTTTGQCRARGYPICLQKLTRRLNELKGLRPEPNADLLGEWPDRKKLRNTLSS
jgi:hypothetical protein